MTHPSARPPWGLWGAVAVLACAAAWRGTAGFSEEAKPSTARGATYLVPLNSADAAELRLLPGVGPVLAEKIAAHRDAIGGFATVDAIRSVDGVGAVKAERLRPWVTLD